MQKEGTTAPLALVTPPLPRQVGCCCLLRKAGGCLGTSSSPGSNSGFSFPGRPPWSLLCTGRAVPLRWGVPRERIGPVPFRGRRGAQGAPSLGGGEPPWSCCQWEPLLGLGEEGISGLPCPVQRLTLALLQQISKGDPGMRTLPWGVSGFRGLSGSFWLLSLGAGGQEEGESSSQEICHRRRKEEFPSPS